jgi:rRNA maturation endonuclease Nob1
MKNSEVIKFCGYCRKKTKHNKDVCKECGSDNTKIQGFNSNLM